MNYFTKLTITAALLYVTNFVSGCTQKPSRPFPDFNNDGIQDVARPMPTKAGIEIFLRNSDGKEEKVFGYEMPREVYDPVRQLYLDTRIGDFSNIEYDDFNNDGHDDVEAKFHFAQMFIRGLGDVFPHQIYEFLNDGTGRNFTVVPKDIFYEPRMGPIQKPPMKRDKDSIFPLASAE